MSNLPTSVVRMLARRERRMHHYLFHQTRNMWLFWDSAITTQIKALGWEPPRPSRRPNSSGGIEAVIDNSSGEDFLFMHRKMIAGVNMKLAEIGDTNYLKIEGWKTLPKPLDTEYPVPPAWDTGDANFNAHLQAIKSDSYFQNNFEVWERTYKDPAVLASMTLGELGARLEFSIHNMMHMRWCREVDRRPDVDPTTPGQIDPKWDAISYNWLGDTYSSHVNPVFWKLHDWIDDRIDDWMSANNLSGPVPWKGTWVGKMPPHPVPESLHATLAAPQPETESMMHEMSDHASEMEEVAKIILHSGKICQFYDAVDVPEL